MKWGRSIAGIPLCALAILGVLTPLTPSRANGQEHNYGAGGFSNVTPIQEESDEVQRWGDPESREKFRHPSQQKPGYKRMKYSPGEIYVINMIWKQPVTIQLPEDEVALKEQLGDPNDFEMNTMGKGLRTFNVRALRENSRTNLKIIGDTGRIYNFMLLSRLRSQYPYTEDVIVEVIDLESTEDQGYSQGLSPLAPRIWEDPRATRSTEYHRAFAPGTNDPARFTDDTILGDAGGAESIVHDVRLQAVDRASRKYLRPKDAYRNHYWTFIDFGPEIRGGGLFPEAYQITGGVEQPVQQVWRNNKLIIKSRGKFVIRAGRLAICAAEEKPVGAFLTARENRKLRKKHPHDPRLRTPVDLTVHGMALEEVRKIVHSLEHADIIQVRPGTLRGEVKVFEMGRAQAEEACAYIGRYGAYCQFERSRARRAREKRYIPPASETSEPQKRGN